MAENTWWKSGIVYQIYPRSFQDTNGDGIGDLKGICQRLDYLAWLGIDAVWISPIYTSPMADFGYDVADYCGIDPIFGSIEDFDQLIKETHARGLKLILDFVPNHTSNQHPWFLESKSSRDNPKRDWYIWRDPGPDGAPPNNWVSNFGGSGWEWDETTGQFYYHAFLAEQPDLNWRNPEVRRAMYDVLRFWLNRGVDGFRVDVIWHLIKDGEFRDNPPNLGYQPSQAEINRFLQIYSADQPEVHDVITEMRRVLEEFQDRVLIGEIYLPLERLVAYYGPDLTGAHLPFNFQLIHTAWNAREIAALVTEYDGAIPDGGWPNWVLGNHDQPRIGARVGSAQARVAAMLLLTLRGTPTLYYGDEIGIGKVDLPADAVQDPWEKNEPGLGLGRDPQRTPMQWTSENYAGFSKAKPWLPTDPGFANANVQILRKDERSILNLYRELIRVRKQHRALSIGKYRAIETHGHLFAFERTHQSECVVVALNLSSERIHFTLPSHAHGAKLLLSSYLDHTGERVGADIHLRSDEGVILVLDQ